MFSGDIVFTNNEAVSYNLNQDINPVHHFDVIPDMRVDDSRIKPLTHGVYPTPTMRDGMSIEMEFDLLADSASDYVSKRKTLIAALMGANFTGLVTNTQMGTLSIPFSGETENWDALVTVKAISGPKEWQEGTYSTFMLTLYSFVAYFTGHTTPANKYRWT